MRRRLRRVGSAAFCVGWFAALALAVRSSATARDTSPEHLLGLLGAAYLAAWGPFFLLSRHGPIGRGARFVAGTVSALAALMVFEAPAALGLVDYRELFANPAPAWRRTGNRPDPELIFVREGHRRTRLRFRGADVAGLAGVPATPTYRCDLRLDDRGFRNPRDLASADVVVLGDSFIEGLQVEPSQLMTSRLAGRLNVTVANLGRTGYGPQQELGVLRRDGLALRPAVCVWSFYEGNDLQDLAAYPAQRDQACRALRESARKTFYARTFARNALAFTIRNWLRPESMRPAALFAGRFADGSGRTRSVYFSCGVHEGAGLPGAPRGESVELAAFGSILAEASALCGRDGVELIVAFVPAKFRVYGDLCTFAADSPCRNYRVDDLPQAVRGVVESVGGGVRFLDLTPRLRAEAEAGNLVYLADDTHWSAEGHRCAADAVAELLADKGPLRDRRAGRREERSRGLGLSGLGGRVVTGGPASEGEFHVPEGDPREE